MAATNTAAAEADSRQCAAEDHYREYHHRGFTIIRDCVSASTIACLQREASRVQDLLTTPDTTLEDFDYNLDLWRGVDLPADSVVRTTQHGESCLLTLDPPPPHHHGVPHSVRESQSCRRPDADRRRRKLSNGTSLLHPPESGATSHGMGDAALLSPSPKRPLRCQASSQ